MKYPDILQLWTSCLPNAARWPGISRLCPLLTKMCRPTATGTGSWTGRTSWASGKRSWRTAATRWTMWRLRSGCLTATTTGASARRSWGRRWSTWASDAQRSMSSSCTIYSSKTSSNVEPFRPWCYFYFHDFATIVKCLGLGSLDLLVLSCQIIVPEKISNSASLKRCLKSLRFCHLKAFFLRKKSQVWSHQFSGHYKNICNLRAPFQPTLHWISCQNYRFITLNWWSTRM